MRKETSYMFYYLNKHKSTTQSQRNCYNIYY